MSLLIKPRSLSVLTRTERRPAGASLILSAFGMFDLRSPDPRRFEGEQALWTMVAKELPSGRILDLGLPKPTAEILVAGHAAALEGAPVQRMGLSWTVAGRHKDLLVTGDRFWRLGEASTEATEPRSFLQMPLVPARCFGGPGHADNPEGAGFRAHDRLLAQEIVALPNIEIPEAAIRSIGDTPPSAAFGPIALDSPQRLRLAGTYDAAWLKTRAPALAADVDPRFFLLAPEDQRLPRHLEGGEPYRLVNFAADAPEIADRLPGFRVRCFVGWTDPAKPVTEVTLRIDTLWLFAGARRGILIYRGALPVGDIEAADVADTMFVYERLSEDPHPAEHYLRIRALRLDKDNGHKHAFSEHQLAPPLAPEVLEARAVKRRDLAAARLAKWREDMAWSRTKMLEQSGLPRELWPEMESPEPEHLDIPTPLPEELASGELDLAEILDAMEASAAKIEATVAGIEAEHAASAAILSGEAGPESVDRLLAAFGDTKGPAALDAALAEMPDLSALLPEGHDKAEEIAEIEALRDWRGAFLGSARPEVDEAAQLRLARARFFDLPEGRPLASLRANEGEDPFAIPDLDAILAGATRPEVTPPAPGEAEAALDRILDMIASAPDIPADAAERIRGPLADTDDALRKMFPNLGAAPGQALSALMTAEGAGPPAPTDPAEAIAIAKAEMAKLSASLDDSERTLIDSLREARQFAPKPIAPEQPLAPAVARSLGDLILTEARSGLSLTGRDLAGADLRGTDLSGLDLSGAMLEQARLDGARLAGCRLTGATLCGASLVGADLSGCDLEKANLCAVEGRDSRFGGARLVAASVLGASFRGAVFDEAEIEDLTAMEMAFDGASFRHVRMRGGSFMACTLAGTDWTGATLGTSQFMDVEASGIVFAQARLFEVSFLKVRAAGCDFHETELVSVIFAGEADLRGGQFQRITSHQLCFQTADLSGASFERARLDGACFIETGMGRANFRAASLRKALLSRNDLRGADFIAANLFEAQLNRADLRGATLRAANLYGADLADADLVGADLTATHLARTMLETPSDG